MGVGKGLRTDAVTGDAKDLGESLAICLHCATCFSVSTCKFPHVEIVVNTYIVGSETGGYVNTILFSLLLFHELFPIQVPRFEMSIN